MWVTRAKIRKPCYGKKDWENVAFYLPRNSTIRCYSYAATTGYGECAHETVDERDLIGTWVIDEVRLAVQKVYEVIEIFEVYEYAVTQYDPQTGQGGHFVEYVDTFIKLKTEASGYPDWV